jgi:conjugal transfer pilus assembly protein TraV
MKTFSRSLSVSITLGIAIATAGCSSVLTPLGENHYDCNRKENPDSLYCHSFRSVESATAGAIPDSRYDEQLNISEHDKLTGIAPTSAGKAGQKDTSDSSLSSTHNDNAIVPHQLGGTHLDGLPVREGPVVQRVWIKRFVDSQDLLTSDTYVYKEVVPTHWSGFDVNYQQQGSFSGIYPHKPAAPVAGKLLTAQKSNSDLKAPAHNDFIQPGPKQSESGETATAPAENGANTMPN